MNLKLDEIEYCSVFVAFILYFLALGNVIEVNLDGCMHFQ